MTAEMFCTPTTIKESLQTLFYHISYGHTSHSIIFLYLYDTLCFFLYQEVFVEISSLMAITKYAILAYISYKTTFWVIFFLLLWIYEFIS